MLDTAKRLARPENLNFRNHLESFDDDKAEILQGLQKKQKTTNPKYFYDTHGSELFEEITQLDEYYPTRTERKILSTHAQEISACCGEGCTLIEPGSGSSEKVRLLLDNIRPNTYVPMDIANEFLQSSAAKLAKEFEWLDVHALCTDFSRLQHMPDDLPKGKRVVFYPGSTLGNMIPEDALEFLKQIYRWIHSGNEASQGGLLIGVDLHKCSARLNAAYNDKHGVTAAFNLNILNNINRIVDANFNTNNFKHHAFYNEEYQRIEMHLISQADHLVNLAGKLIPFRKGESIHTENSYKYTLKRFTELADKAGFRICSTWTDDEALFSVHYLALKADAFS